MSAAEERSPRRRVLVVDDDPEIVTFLATLLELEGIDSTVATSAAAALEKLEHAVPNLVLLDIAMPDRDGLDLCRALKKDPQTADIRVVMLTARAQRADRERGAEAGADSYITKPFSTDELREHVQRLL
jgi:CheY-like chemotaxis protein